MADLWIKGLKNVPDTFNSPDFHDKKNRKLFDFEKDGDILIFETSASGGQASKNGSSGKIKNNYSINNFSTSRNKNGREGIACNYRKSCQGKGNGA
jgi:hypothetical protein